MEKQIGYLQHGNDTQGPFRTEAVTIKWEAPDNYYIFFEGKWRKVFYRVNKPLYINYNKQKIAILIKGV